MKSEWHENIGKGWTDHSIKEVYEHKSGFTISYSFLSQFVKKQKLPEGSLPDMLEDLRELYFSYYS